MSIWRPKKDILFQTAKNKVTNLTTVIEEGVKPDLIQNRFIRIVENNPNSPLIMGLGENKHLIFYPANSTPYLHQYETSIKYVEVLSGEIFDQLTEKRYKSGDRFKILPGVQIKA